MVTRLDTPLPLVRIAELATDMTFLAAVERCFEALDRRVADRNPVCVNRGLCCHFAKFDHRLFVTSAELAYFVGRVVSPGVASSGVASSDQVMSRGLESGGSCPHHVGGVCTTRTARPAGCRIFFCDPNAQAWQADEYELALAEIKALHSHFNLEYVYVEWLASLRQWREFAGTASFGVAV